MKIRAIKSRLFARLGKLTPVITTPAPKPLYADIPVEPALYIVYRRKDGETVAPYVTLDAAEALVAKAKAAKKASLEYKLAA